MLRIILAVVHLLALGIGLGAVWARARSLGGSLDANTLRRALVADSWWGVAAGLWLATGLWRLLAGTEKGTEYYMNNHIFFAKMGLFALVFLLELWPMITLIRWRAGSVRPAGAAAKRIAMISYLECVLVIAIVVAAVMMARGYGVRTS